MKISFPIMLLIITVLCAGYLPAVEKAAPSSVVGKIDNRTITYAEYNQMLSNFTNAQQARGVKITEDKRKELNNQLWEEIIGRTIYDQEIKRRRIVVSDQEAYNKVVANPPQDVKVIKDLQVNGKFSVDRFKEAMEKNPKFKQSVLDFMKETMVYDKLFAVIRAQAKVKPDSVKDVWLKDNDLVSAKIISFDYNKITSVTVSDSETVQYYNDNLETFKKDPARKYRYVRLSPVTYVKPKADSIYKALQDGADFAELAHKFSGDPGSAEKGGDLGWFSKGKMVKPFEEAVFKLQVGQLSEPVQSQYGWHIIQLMDRKTVPGGEDSLLARHILIKGDKDILASQAMKVDADKIYNKAKEVGLVATAQEMALTTEMTPDFYAKDRFIRGMGRFQELIAEAFAHPLGYIPLPVSAPSGEMFVCEVGDTIGVHYSPYEAEKQNVISKITTLKKMAANKERAQLFYKTNGPYTYIMMAEKDSLTIVQADDLKKDSPIKDLGNVNVLVDSLLTLEEGKFTSLIEADNKYYLGYVTKRVKPNLKAWEKAKNKLLAKAKEDLQRQKLSTWYYAQRQQLKIEDNRKNYYNLEQPARSQPIELRPN